MIQSEVYFDAKECQFCVVEMLLRVSRTVALTVEATSRAATSTRSTCQTEHMFTHSVYTELNQM